ncbi:MAG: phosphoglucosamine mutase [Myxococcota bacterium]
MKKLFGTDGVRGIANQEPMTPEIALRLGQAAGYIFSGKGKSGRFLIGKDTRLSCYMFENAIASGIMSTGGDVYFVGPMPTPAIAHLTTSMRADAGIVISASHNPYDHNGIKFFSSKGYKLPDKTEKLIEKFVFSDDFKQNLVTKKNIGRSRRIDDASGRYITFCKNSFPEEMSMDGLRLVVDCAHGAAYKVAPLIFEELGAEVIPVGVKPNGVNINDYSGALYPQNTAKLVTKYRADLGIALDGDADRAILIDEKGEIVHGDAILALIASRMLKNNSLAHKTLVTTVMSNLGLDHALKRFGGKVVRTDVGDRNVFQEMQENGYNLGGEQSGHIILRDHATTGDGIIASLQVLSIILDERKSLSELKNLIDYMPQVLKNLKVSEKPPLASIEGYNKLFEKLSKKLGDQGRIFIRYSGTELKVRVLVECNNKTQAEEIADTMIHFFKRKIGA